MIFPPKPREKIKVKYICGQGPSTTIKYKIYMAKQLEVTPACVPHPPFKLNNIFWHPFSIILATPFLQLVSF